MMGSWTHDSIQSKEMSANSRLDECKAISSRKLNNDIDVLSARLMGIEQPDDYIFQQIKRNKAIVKNVLEKEKSAMHEN